MLVLKALPARTYVLVTHTCIDVMCVHGDVTVFLNTGVAVVVHCCILNFCLTLRDPMVQARTHALAVQYRLVELLCCTMLVSTSRHDRVPVV